MDGERPRAVCRRWGRSVTFDNAIDMALHPPDWSVADSSGWPDVVGAVIEGGAGEHCRACRSCESARTTRNSLSSGQRGFARAEAQSVFEVQPQFVSIGRRKDTRPNIGHRRRSLTLTRISEVERSYTCGGASRLTKVSEVGRTVSRKGAINHSTPSTGPFDTSGEINYN